VTEQQGTFIAYASAPGRTASDRWEKSDPYAKALAAELGKPGLDQLNLFQNVKEAALASTDGAQRRWESNGLGRRVCLPGPPKPPEVPDGDFKCKFLGLFHPISMSLMLMAIHSPTWDEARVSQSSSCTGRLQTIAHGILCWNL